MATTQKDMAWEVYERLNGEKAIRIKPQPEISVLGLHKRIETRILKVESPVLGMKIDGYRQKILDIIEDEFGKLDNL